MSMQVLVQWCYSFIQLNKSNYSFFLSFHRMISTWMNSGCLLTSLETKGNHHRGIGVKAISFQNPSQQTRFQLWPSLHISNTSTLKWYGNVYTITDYRCLHHTLLIKARTWNHFRNCFFISLSDWIWSILYFFHGSSLKLISHSSPPPRELVSTGVFVPFPPFGTLHN